MCGKVWNCENCKSKMLEVVEVHFPTKKKNILMECTNCNRQLLLRVVNMNERDIIVNTRRYYKYIETIEPKNDWVLDVFMGVKTRWIRRFIGVPERILPRSVVQKKMYIIGGD